MNLSLAPTLIYDKSLKFCDTIGADELSPIIHMKIDFSETFVIYTNKIGTFYIYILLIIIKKNENGF